MSKEIEPDFPVFEANENSYEDSKYDLMYDTDIIKTDTTGRTYRSLGSFLENDDFYQGLCMITVIRRESDNKLFGYSWWDDISKHGESYIEPNGDEFGLECDTSADDFDWDNDYVSCFVFEPVEEYSIKAYKKVR